MQARLAFALLSQTLLSLRRTLNSCIAVSLIALLFFSGTACGALGLGAQEDDDDLTELLLFAGLLIFASNPCNSIASPTIASAWPRAAP